VEAIFKPTREIREAAAVVSRAFDLPPDWLNDAAKAFFLTDPPRRELLNLSNLRILAPAADYMLAMKCVSARFDTHDRTDVAFLMKHLGLSNPDTVFELISRYYPRTQIPAKAKFLVEELLAI
jgi:hypothetical protein